MPDEGSIADNMGKGKGLVRGFKTVGQGLKGEDTHPEVTGVDPAKKGPGRPTTGESFKVVGKSAEQEDKAD